MEKVMTSQFLLTEIITRLGLAMLAGIVLGLNRWLHHKSAGIRTHTLVSVGAALGLLLITAIVGGDAQAQSRVLQGTISGIGFLGAGVIVHQGASGNVKGLTTAASIWVVAIIGCCFGAGQLLIGIAGILSILVILLLGRPLEKGVAKILGIVRGSELDNNDEDTRI
jgi:putative Mg2+ transporter-C (MgtC) family protein